jgi:predicted esterase
LARLLTESYDNRESLRKLSGRNPAARVAIFHGTGDELIPKRMGRELAELQPSATDYIRLQEAIT